MEAGSVPPTSEERTILLSSVLVQARPLHLAFSLAYIEQFAFSLPSELEASLATLVHAVKMVELTLEKRCQSAKRREVSLEQLIGLTDELENRYGRHGELESDRPRYNTSTVTFTFTSTFTFTLGITSTADPSKFSDQEYERVGEREAG